MYDNYNKYYIYLYRLYICISIYYLFIFFKIYINPLSSVVKTRATSRVGDAELVLTLLRAGADHLRGSASGQTAMDFAGSEEVLVAHIRWKPMAIVSFSIDFSGCWAIARCI